MPEFALRMVLASAFVLMSACSRSADPTSSSNPVASSSPVPAAASATPSQAASSAPGAKSMKEYASTPAERLGTLPAGTGVPVGQPAPDAELEDFRGSRVKLRDEFKKGPVLLAFYRGGWCPYCSFEIHDFVKAYPDYQARGVTPIAISVDRPEESAKTKASFDIPFPVLSDPDLRAHEAFHVVHHASDDEVSKLKGFGIDIERSSGKSHHRFAIPALFLVDASGKVRWAHADPDYKVRPRTAQILAALDAAGFTPKK